MEREADEVALATVKTTGLIADKLEQQAQEIERRYQVLNARRAELQKVLKLELTDGTIGNLMQFREIVAEELGVPTFEDKRRWLELLQVRITVTNGGAVISCRLSRGEPSLAVTQPFEVQVDRSLLLNRPWIEIVLTHEPVELKVWRSALAGSPA